MTDEEKTLAEIRAHLEAQPLEVRVMVNRFKDAMYMMIAVQPQYGEMALALLGAELAARP